MCFALYFFFLPLDRNISNLQCCIKANRKIRQDHLEYFFFVSHFKPLVSSTLVYDSQVLNNYVKFDHFLPGNVEIFTSHALVTSMSPLAYILYHILHLFLDKHRSVYMLLLVSELQLLWGHEDHIYADILAAVNGFSHAHCLWIDIVCRSNCEGKKEQGTVPCGESHIQEEWSVMRNWCQDLVRTVLTCLLSMLLLMQLAS